jgi:hypothetical protein
MDLATREALEGKLVASYETSVALKSMLRSGAGQSMVLEEALTREMQIQRYLHALLGYKGEPPGLLY